MHELASRLVTSIKLPLMSIPLNGRKWKPSATRGRQELLNSTN